MMKHQGKVILFAMAGWISLAQAVSGQSVATTSGATTSAGTTSAGTPSAASAPTVIPALVPFTGTVEGADGKLLTGEVSMTFLLFKDEAGGEPLWTESQRVTIDPTSHYKVQLGGSSPSGLPLTVFASGEARWLEVQVAGQKPQARVLLSTVPYAAKAADAATLGGLPASAFMLAGQQNASSASASVTPDAASTVTTTGGTTNYLPVFTGASTIANSVIVQDGSSVGIGVVPNTSVKLDVGGGMIMRGPMIVSRTGNASATTAYPSFGFAFYSNAYNSSTKATDNPHFLLQSEPTGNNTPNTGATFNLLYSNHGTAPAETGLSINPTGIISFAPGQTFPGGGSGGGTITGVTAGTDLTGGGTSGNVTLNIDTTKVALLGASNNFTASQTITGGYLNMSPTSAPLVGPIYIGGVPFLHGYGGSGNKNVWVGGAGNFSTSSSNNAGVGYQALYSQTSGGGNTAVGDVALYATTTGSNNTAVGNDALFSNTTGTGNTALGAASGPVFGDLALTNSTAVGYGAAVGQSNSLILGQTASKPGTSYVNVGVGTETPGSILELSQSVTGGLGPVITLTNPAGQSGASAAIDFNTSTPAYGSGYVPNAEIRAVDAGGYTDSLYFFSNIPGALNKGYQLNREIASNGQVGIGTPVPADYAQLVVTQGEGNIGAIQAFGGTVPAGTYTGVAGSGGSFSGGEGANAIVGTGGNSTGANDAGAGGLFIGGNNYENGGSGAGIYALPGIGGDSTGDAADLVGNVLIAGNMEIFYSLNPSVVGVRVDHPLDPANKYLTLSSVQSPEMTNVYSGNVTTDELGLATVTLPDWFEAMNGDFRYQLTVIGGRFAQAIVSKEIADHKFTIGTNAAHVKVSWQVTAVRQDAYAKAHPLLVEEQKPERERGFYRNAELYGQPEEKQTQWAHSPQLMKKAKALREAAKKTAVNGPPARSERQVASSEDRVNR